MKIINKLDGLISKNIGLCFFLTISFMPIVSQAAAGKGFVTGEYHLEAALDELVTPIRETEKWARVWMPEKPGKYPLIVFLHGNHPTCGINAPGYGVRLDGNAEYT